MKRQVLSLLIIGTLTASCAQQDDNRLGQKAEVEGRAASAAEQEILNTRATGMESDLARRHRFYQSLRGVYIGTYSTSAGTFSTKIKLMPSLPPYIPPSRVRTLEEISSDLNSLYFNIQVLHWNPSDESSATGCVFQEIRGDLERGRLDAATADCRNVYSLRIVDPVKPFQKSDELETNSQSLTMSILEGKVSSVPTLQVFMQTSNNASEFALTLKRAE